ncbi:MAG TPA: PAS-domain containing protein, partial [Alphaproteobacteria bacterium]|nr:PAS-domain containing protein [Alphaproteobacteria bacterium]
MSQPIVISAPFIAAAAVIVAAFVVIGFKAGFDVATLAVVGLAGITGGLAWLTFTLTRQLRQRDMQLQRAARMQMTAERMQGIVQAAPGGYCLFSPQGNLREAARVAPLLGVAKIAHADDLVAAIADNEEFLASFRKLQQTGEAFALDARTTGGKAVRISGRRFRLGREGPPLDVLWFQEGAGAPPAEVPLAGRARAAQAVLDALPFPFWMRGPDLNVILCNRAYAKALDAAPAEIIEAQHELVASSTHGGTGRMLAGRAAEAGTPQSERQHVIVAGKRQLLEISEIPVKDDKGELVALAGLALDVTVEEEKETELQRHLAAHHEVLEHLGSAIAIYGPDMRLEFYNRAYQRLWEAEESFLNGKPTFGEVIEDLRARRRAPEQADFQRYKKERLSLFTSLLEPREDLMHLPDGTSLRILAVPHPFGGIMFVHEDVTDKLALESSYNTLIAVQRETLDNLAEGIAVFGPDGKLHLYNPAFARIWKLAPDFLESHPHIADLLEHMKPLFDFGANWGEFKNEMVGYTLDRSSRKGRIERADQAVLEYITVPLPDGAALASYLDVTDSVRVEQALRASNAALAAADRLKSEFVANVS